MDIKRYNLINIEKIIDITKSSPIIRMYTIDGLYDFFEEELSKDAIEEIVNVIGINSINRKYTKSTTENEFPHYGVEYDVCDFIEVLERITYMTTMYNSKYY